MIYIFLTVNSNGLSNGEAVYCLAVQPECLFIIYMYFGIHYQHQHSTPLMLSQRCYHSYVRTQPLQCPHQNSLLIFSTPVLCILKIVHLSHFSLLNGAVQWIRSQLLAYHNGSPASLPVWDLWWTKLYEDGFISSTFRCTLSVSIITQLLYTYLHLPTTLLNLSNRQRR